MAESGKRHEIVRVTTEMVRGTCVSFGSAYGFFRVPGVAKDVFVHVTALPKDADNKYVRPEVGSTVRFRYGTRADDPTKFEAVGVVEVTQPRQMKKKAA